MPHTNSAPRVLVFAKAPTPGLAKTRLIPVLGAEGAAALHARLIKHTLSTARQASLGALELHGTPVEDDFLRFCAGRYDAKLIAQEEGDLGARMYASLRRALTGSDVAILVGSDCPALTAGHLRHAAQRLADGDDAVFAPTEDGGYALIGLRRCDARLFEAVSWSSACVMAQTRDHLRALRWRWSELDPLWDIDRPDDYERLLASRLLERGRPN